MEHVDVAVIGGGQSGLAAAHALRRLGLQPVVLEASEQAAGSWPRYYDSLTLFSPARYSCLPGLPFGGDPDRYPHRDEVVAYLLRCADRLDAEIRTRTRVHDVRLEDGAFALGLEGGGRLAARAVIAATGTFGRPHRPDVPGLETYTGTLLHAADYRAPEPFDGQRIVVVGAGNSAVQIAAELGGRAQVTLAARHPVRFARQLTLGRDLHWWLARTGLDTLPVGRFLSTPPTQMVIDDGLYRAAVASGRPDRRPVFTGIGGTKVTWADGSTEEVDAIVLATGYRPNLGYVTPLGALTATGHPRHREGMSLTHPGLAYVGLEWQRSLSSNSLRGVGRDAARAARHIAAHLSRA
ncbi:flavin-containing monooxygenase [Streptomyces scabiei]|uniref:flavin-containing monooxygenase n=1 Tax=Streptomyces scabiei TaxID=1930 RepID=UPI0029B6562E|nr:NAD(P)/FAD-dependent oxidoreductase [Streptomyces scabiei]MDX2531564.1 NAD(P)/FAD-dependent oxidoreductase [Streptomyces scabiei]MDX2796622.1 NAD(P)/FAD-dependent oxidoreductase [Streptomyces scabiei]MDX2855858.1 NAD(P)/FAD-dependent oxidoreductase [Streptomyces scabiei]MDX3824590.1 NAD(P)/FAD-dependent oxidoreductase [Streptomyces scabiei]